MIEEAVPGEGEMEKLSETQKKRVCYFFDSDIGNYHYGPSHPMKPTRIRMCHSLVMNYGLYKKMEIFRAKPATKREMSQFHTDDYVDFLYRITPENMNGYAKEQQKFNVGDDSPIFDGLFEYCSISAGGSMEGAARLSRDKCDIAVNWAGGLHHAKKAEASGFCYVNDIVLGILELLRYHQRVLYIDIDVHHGDGVEEAFYTTDRVMTISLHKYGEFFPGTGDVRDTGIGKGKNYSVNVPLRDGITDVQYKDIFESVTRKTIEWYGPGAIVLQCGADSLAGDKLGCFNLSLQGHSDCITFVKSFNLPLLLVGGGGYTVRAVSRAWAYETGLAAGVKLGKRIPSNEYYEYYGPDYELDVKASNMEDMNTPEYLHKIKRSIFEQMRDMDATPGIQIGPTPKMKHDDEDGNEDEDMEDPNVRVSARERDNRVQRDGELSDSDDEGLGHRRHHQSHREGSAGTSVGSGSKGKGRASPAPSGVSNGNGKKPRKASASKSASPSRPVGSGSGNVAEAPAMPGAVVPTAAVLAPSEPATDVDMDKVKAEITEDITAGTMTPEAVAATSLGPSSDSLPPPPSLPVPTAATPTVEPARAETFSNASILPVGKLANEVGETTPEPRKMELPAVVKEAVVETEAGAEPMVVDET